MISSRSIFFLLGLLALTSAAWTGCVTPAYYEYYSSFTVHQISSRSQAGTETLFTIVTPTPSSDSAKAYPDTLQYIIVNGDTAYRHPVSGISPTFDSLAPYRTDGTINYVALVYPNLTILDTTYETAFSSSITSPPDGDTIHRNSDLAIGYQSSAENSSLRCFVQVTDSSTFYSSDIPLGTSGTVDFPSANMEKLASGTLWADLQVGEYATDYFITALAYYEIIVEHQVVLDRIIAYPLR